MSFFGAWLLVCWLATCLVTSHAVEVTCSGAYKSGIIKTLPQTPKGGFGVLFVANHGDPEQHRHFIQLALKSAQSYARVSPQLPRALITNARGAALPENGTFTHIISIPECLLVPSFSKPQKLTRTLSYHLTPFELTLAVDLDTFCCTDLYPVLKHVYETQRGAFVMAAAGHEQVVWHPDHGVKLFWWNDAMRQLLFLWEESQVQLGITSSDQIALMHAVRTHPEVDWRFSRLPSSISCRIRPGENESFAMGWFERHFSQSLPLTGPLYVIHMAGLDDIYSLVCGMANSRADHTRVITFKHSELFPTNETVDQSFHVAYDQAECNTQMAGKCLRSLDWNPRPFAIEPVDKRDYEWR